MKESLSNRCFKTIACETNMMLSEHKNMIEYIESYGCKQAEMCLNGLESKVSFANGRINLMFEICGVKLRSFQAFRVRFQNEVHPAK